MKEADIRRYAGLMKELGLTGLEISEENSRVRLERSNSLPVQKTTLTVSESESESETEPAALSEEYISVRSPIVGIFYAGPAENADSYVSVGDHVTKGQTLCIVEAMKLMNELSAEEDGIISSVCVKNGQLVEYGTELFRIRR